MEIRIRPASRPDLPPVTQMTEERRVQYQEYQPVFWRKAADSEALASDFMAEQLSREDLLFLVAEQRERILGFLVATEISAPPVYDPHGPTYHVDDFCVQAPDLWSTVGKALLDHARDMLRERGVAQIVVVCGDLDRPKAEMLRRERLTIASNWWTQPL